MKICITSKGKDLDSDVDPRFGRCQNFIFVDTEKETLIEEAVQNENAMQAGGAGIKAGQFMSDKNVEAVLTGNVGPNAFDTLNAAEIKIIVGVSGKVKDAIQKFKNGEYQNVSAPSVDSHSGMQ